MAYGNPMNALVRDIVADRNVVNDVISYNSSYNRVVHMKFTCNLDNVQTINMIYMEDVNNAESYRNELNKLQQTYFQQNPQQRNDYWIKDWFEEMVREQTVAVGQFSPNARIEYRNNGDLLFFQNDKIVILYPNLLSPYEKMTRHAFLKFVEDSSRFCKENDYCFEMYAENETMVSRIIGLYNKLGNEGLALPVVSIDKDCTSVIMYYEHSTISAKPKNVFFFDYNGRAKSEKLSGKFNNKEEFLQWIEDEVKPACQEQRINYSTYVRNLENKRENKNTTFLTNLNQAQNDRQFNEMVHNKINREDSETKMNQDLYKIQKEIKRRIQSQKESCDIGDEYY